MNIQKTLAPAGGLQAGARFAAQYRVFALFSE